MFVSILFQFDIPNETLKTQKWSSKKPPAVDVPRHRWQPVNAAVPVERSLGHFLSGEAVHYKNLLFAEIQSTEWMAEFLSI